MKNPIITMSAIAGKPSYEEIYEYVLALNKNGIEQILLYPRSGCELEYMSEEWFNTIGYYLEIAKKLDMDVWLYDEFNWPSGNCNGLVTEFGEFRLKSIEVIGENVGKISFASTYKSSLFGEKYFPDLLCDKAVELFISSTHEKYYERFKSYFGKVIKGIFTDEPAIGYSTTSNSVPYYEGMERDYREMTGRSFNDDLKKSTEYFCQTALELAGQRFKDCYINKIAKWCCEHKIVMTGHLFEDDNPVNTERQNGDFLSVLSAFTMPGIDEIETNLCSKKLLPLLGAAEYAKGNNGAMAELFALGPCDNTYAKKRCMIFLTACFGIDHYFVISHIDKCGNSLICDFFNDFSDDQPDFEGMKVLSEDAKKAAEYAQKEYTPDVYVRYPTDVIAKNNAKSAEIRNRTDRLFDIISMLSYNQIQWKFINKEDYRGAIPLIEFSDDYKYIVNGKEEEDCGAVCGALKKSPRLTDKNANLPENVFLRIFDDNSFILINLSCDENVLYMNGEEIELGKYGVYVGELGKAPDKRKRQDIIDVNFDIKYLNENIARCMYINSQTDFKIICDGEFPVRFAVRSGALAHIPGEKTECRYYCDILPRGFRKSYNSYDTVTLKKGENTVSSTDDYKYLPSVFLVGDFAYRIVSGSICKLFISQRKRIFSPGDKFFDFGRIEFETKLKVPKGAKALVIEGTDLYTAVFANGHKLGEKICSPYIYAVDKNMQSSVIELKIHQASTLGPIFGDIDYFDKNSDSVKWKNLKSVGKTLFGFDKISWEF